MNLTAYEKKARSQIDAFKNPEQSLLGNVRDAVNKPLSAVGELATRNKAGEAASRALVGVVEKFNDASSFSVRREAIFEDFRDDGHAEVEGIGDIRTLELEDVENTVGYLAAKYKGLATGEGFAAGLSGIAGLAADIPAFLGLALRAVNEFATYYGFDTQHEGERVFAMKLLTLASSPTSEAKRASLRELTSVIEAVAESQGWDRLAGFAPSNAVHKIAEKLSLRLAKAKLAQVMPVIGAGVGGGYNALYMAAITKSARMMYRERFLVSRHGPDAIVRVRE
jgi:hypothetical protein